VSVFAEVFDPDGRRVELTAERWAHIAGPGSHPELAGLLAEVLRAVSEPTQVRAGREPDEMWFYLQDVGPSRWLKVVVVFEPDRAYIVTAFPRRRLP
jgi:hypothetical protein